MRISEAISKSPWTLRHCPRDDQESLKVFNRAECDVWIREAKTGTGRQVVMVLARGRADFAAVGTQRKVTFLKQGPPNLGTS